MFKKISVISCDICGSHEVEINRCNFFNGYGYVPAWDDPFTQKHKRLEIAFDLCDHCFNGVQAKACSYSKEERSDLIAIRIIQEGKQNA